MTTPRRPAVRREVSREEIARLADFARRLFAPDADVLAVYLYGSAARGEPAADLDVALLCEGDGPGARSLEGYAQALETQGAPLEIDLRVLDGSTPRFAANVLRDGVILFDRDPRARARREAQLMVQWMDFRPTWERMRRRMLDRLQHG